MLTLNQKGLAVFEIIPILIIFVLLINFVIGFFGIIHSGILNSIAARNYAFETFGNRANLNYFRDLEMPAKDLDTGFLTNFGFRYHGIIAEGAPAGIWSATKRSIKFSDNAENSLDQSAIHIQQVARVVAGVKVSDSAPTINKDDFTRVWVRTVYGICLNKTCGE